MNINCLSNSLLYCDINIIITCLSTTKLIYNLATEHFWKLLCERIADEEIKGNMSWYTKYKLQHKFMEIKKVLYVKNDPVIWTAKVNYETCAPYISKTTCRNPDTISVITASFRHITCTDIDESNIKLYRKRNVSKYYNMLYYLHDDFNNKLVSVCFYNIVKRFDIEQNMLISWFKLIKRLKPDLILGEKLDSLYYKLKEVYSDIIN